MAEDSVQLALERLIALTDKQVDSEAAAKKLCSVTGGEARAFEMAAEDIMAQTGLNRAAAEAIDLIDELCRYAGVEEFGEAPLLDSTEKAGGYFMALCRGRHVEHCYLVCLDGRKHLTSCRLMGKGTLDEADVYVRNIAQQALRQGAKYAYLCHNHPGGTLVASEADIALTGRASQALALIGCTLLEHIIVTESGFIGILEERGK